MRLLARHYDTQWRARSGGPDSRGEVRTGVWIGGCVGVRQGRGRATHQHVARIPDGEPGWPSRPSGPGVMAEEATPPSLPPPPPVRRFACVAGKAPSPSPRFRAPPPAAPSHPAPRFLGRYSCARSHLGSGRRFRDEKSSQLFRRYVAHPKLPAESSASRRSELLPLGSEPDAQLRAVAAAFGAGGLGSLAGTSGRKSGRPFRPSQPGSISDPVHGPSRGFRRIASHTVWDAMRL